VNAPQAKRYVVGSLLVAGVLTTTRDLAAGRPPQLRTVIGLAVAGVVLGVAADVQPGIAGGFALLLLISSIFVTGADALAAIREATK